MDTKIQISRELFRVERLQDSQKIEESKISVDSLVDIEYKHLTEKYSNSLLSVLQLQEIFNVCESTIDAMMKDGRLPTIRIGRRKFVSTIHVAKVLAMSTFTV